MRSAVLVPLLICMTVAPAVAGSVERLEAAKSEGEVEAILGKSGRHLSGNHDGYRLLKAAALAFERVDRADRAVTLLRAHREKFEAGAADCLLELEIEILGRAGRVDEALAAARGRLAGAANEKIAWLAHRQIAWLLEKKKDWAGALEHYLVPHPRTKCGTCEEALTDRAVLDVARCRFFAGQVEKALAELDALLVRSEEAGGPHGGAEMPYCEYSVRAGRIKTARERIASLPERQRASMTVRLAVAEAALGKAFETVLAIFELPENRSHLPWDWLAGTLAEMGEPAFTALSKRIEAGSEPVILLSGYTGRVELLPAIEDRLFREADFHLRRTLESARARIVEAGGPRAEHAANVARARRQLMEIEKAARRFFLAHGRHAVTLAELSKPAEDAPEGFLPPVPLDPWKQRYAFVPSRGSEPPVVFSRGPDRRPGTADDIRLR